MARVRDFPAAVAAAGPWQFLKRLYCEIDEDNLFTWAAAMAYSWLFAVFPFFIFLIALVPYLPEDVKVVLKDYLAWVVYQLPKDAADTIWLQVAPTIDQPRQGLLSIGIIITLWAASGGMAMSMAALDKCYDVKESRPYYVQRPLAIALTIAVVVLILAVVVLIPVGTVVTNWVITHGGERISSWLLLLWHATRFALALVLMFVALALVYAFGANHDHKFRLITPGSLFCVAVWLGLGVVFRIYVDRYGQYSRTYGTVGGVAILLLFFYVDSVVLLIGAEINALVDRTARELTGKVEPEPEELLAAADAAPTPPPDAGPSA